MGWGTFACIALGISGGEPIFCNCFIVVCGDGAWRSVLDPDVGRGVSGERCGWDGL